MKAWLIALAIAAPLPAHAAALPKPSDLESHNAAVQAEPFKGRPSLRITPANGTASTNAGLAIIPGSAFHNGTIELEVAGEVGPDADAGSRGFIGVAFRAQPDAKAFEMLYIRPTNGRADDQLRRNHALQYVSEPEFPWERLRKETPGQYEAYADLQPGVWTRLRLVVEGTKARLFVNDAAQPALIVNDLKLGDTTGAIGLWVGSGTIGHFGPIRISRRS